MITPELIQNAALQLSDLPPARPSRMDPEGFTSDAAEVGEWSVFWTFCLTFDGYSFFGGDIAADKRLIDFDTSVEEAFDLNASLPDLDLTLLRSCLFIQQRRWCKWGGSMTRTCPPDTVSYLDALLEAVRRDISPSPVSAVPRETPEWEDE